MENRQNLTELFLTGALINHPDFIRQEVADLGKFTAPELEAWFSAHPEVDTMVVGRPVLEPILALESLFHPTEKHKLFLDGFFGRLVLDGGKREIEIYTDACMYQELAPVRTKGAYLYRARDFAPRTFYYWEAAKDQPAVKGTAESCADDTTARAQPEITRQQVEDLASFLHWGSRGPSDQPDQRTLPRIEAQLDEVVRSTYTLKFYPKDKKRSSLSELSRHCERKGLPAPADMVVAVDDLGLSITLIWVLEPKCQHQPLLAP